MPPIPLSPRRRPLLRGPQAPPQAACNVIQSAIHPAGVGHVPKWNHVAILGVGLIGGSIGLALRQRALCDRVVGIGRQPGRLQLAKKRGAVTETTTSIERGVRNADVVIVCTPVRFVAAHVLEVAEACRPGTLVTDAGSTKELLVQAYRKPSAQGSCIRWQPPLGGKRQERSGFCRGGLVRGSSSSHHTHPPQRCGFRARNPRVLDVAWC